MFFFFYNDENEIEVKSDINETIQSDYFCAIEQLSIENFIEWSNDEINNDKLEQLFGENAEEIFDKVIEYIQYVDNEKLEKEETMLEDTEDSSTNVHPFDPDRIKTRSLPFTSEQLYLMVTGNKNTDVIELDLKPDFQRKNVWKSRQKCAFIESIMLKLPIPTIFLHEQSEGIFSVIDGLQRISTIVEFLGNDLKLSGLEFLKEHNDCYFKNQSYSNNKKDIITRTNVIDPGIMRRIRLHRFNCEIIEKDTPDLVKIEIFKRLNTGGTKLNNQEILNAVMHDDIRIQIKEITKKEGWFHNFIGCHVNRNRFIHHEMLLRLLAFELYFVREGLINKSECDECDKYYNLFEKNEYTYKGSIHSYINEYILILKDNTIPEKIIENLRIRVMNCYDLYEEYSFRKIIYDEKKGIYKKSTINALLYIVQIFSVDLDTKYTEFSKIEYHDLIKSVNDYISSSTNNEVKIKKCFDKFSEYLKGDFDND